MPEINAFEKISNAYYSLTAAEKKVADYVIIHQQESQYMSISELAEACGVAEATISRFARRLNYKGYNAFKLAVAHSTAGRSAGNPLSGQVLAEDGVSDVCQKLFAANVDAMEQTLSLLRPEDVTAAGDLMEQEIPLLGVNLGTLGYLAEVEIGNIETALDKLLRDEYTREARMMLSGGVFREGRNVVHDFALNDIVISRCGSLQILHFHIYVNGRFLNGYGADGMIVATPTGSTGYNMSAGGPIVEPGASLLLLTPICPHTLNTRSIVLAPDDEVVIEIPEGRENCVQKVEASFDGSHRVILQTGDKIVIKKASKTTEILKLNTESFLEVLHKKMSE